MSKMRHKDIEIPTDGAEAFVNCKLDRKQYAEVLTSIVKNYKEGFVLAINNKWGTGKTTFVKMWQQHLKNNHYQTLYFNAWENDFQEEVIIALLSELEELREKDKENFDKLLAKTATFLKKVVPAAIKGAVSKAVGEEAVGEIAAAAMEFTTEEVEQHIAAFNEKKKGITDFRKILEKFVDKVDNDKPVVFIIDELDRCRPDYAVKVLEQVKHLFSVPGIVFVLSIDKIQLSNAIKGFYGSDSLDTDEYLKRFIDLEYIIPEPQLKNFIEYLYNYYAFDDFMGAVQRITYEPFKKDKELFLATCFQFFDSNVFRLRQLEKLFSRMRLTLKMFSPHQYIFPDLIVIIAFLKERHNDVYNGIRNVTLSINELVSKLEPILENYMDNQNYRRIIALEVSVLKFYTNDLVRVYPSRSHSLGQFSKEDNRFVLNFKSKFEDENQIVSRVAQYYIEQYEVNDTELSWIINKYDLTDKIIS